MGLTEQMIQRKILDISNSYLAFTGKNEVWKNGLSLAEYQELRAQAINELERGISFEETEQKSDSERREEEKISGKDPYGLCQEHQKPVEAKLKMQNSHHAKGVDRNEFHESVQTETEQPAEPADEGNLIPYPESKQEKKSSIMDKFEKCKDL